MNKACAVGQARMDAEENECFPARTKVVYDLHLPERVVHIELFTGHLRDKILQFFLRVDEVRKSMNMIFEIEILVIHPCIACTVRHDFLNEPRESGMIASLLGNDQASVEKILDGGRVQALLDNKQTLDDSAVQRR